MGKKIYEKREFLNSYIREERRKKYMYKITKKNEIKIENKIKLNEIILLKLLNCVVFLLLLLLLLLLSLLFFFLVEQEQKQ